MKNSYYVDKTSFLPLLLQGRGPLLITRPRRFGKTLTLDTLRCFVELNYELPGEPQPSAGCLRVWTS